MSRKGLSRIWVLEQCFNICRQGRRMCNRWAKRPLQFPLKILFMCDFACMIRILHYGIGAKQAVQQVILRPKHGWLCVERSGFAFVWMTGTEALTVSVWLWSSGMVNEHLSTSGISSSSQNSVSIIPSRLPVSGSSSAHSATLSAAAIFYHIFFRNAKTWFILCGTVGSTIRKTDQFT